MSLTLGEKLRQAREERGFTLGDVAEQTRISPLYLESIENDDYRILPGGIFNKGFVKSYAKFVGISEADALSDYTALIASTMPAAEEPENAKTYRPEVLTDDRSVGSMLPTVVFAAVILGLMTAGILFFVNYMRQPAQPVATNSTPPPAANTAEPGPETTTNSSGDVPEMASLKIELSAVGQAVSVSSTSDSKQSSTLVNPGTPVTFEPRENLKIGYSRSLANNVKLSINGRDIALPAQPLVPRRSTIEFEINKNNLAQIWANSAISTDAAKAAPVSGDTPAAYAPAAQPAPVAAATPKATPRPAPPANTSANAVARPTASPKPATPAVNRPKPPAGNNVRNR